MREDNRATNPGILASKGNDINDLQAPILPGKSELHFFFFFLFVK